MVSQDRRHLFVTPDPSIDIFYGTGTDVITGTDKQTQVKKLADTHTGIGVRTFTTIVLFYCVVQDNHKVVCVKKCVTLYPNSCYKVAQIVVKSETS